MNVKCLKFNRMTWEIVLNMIMCNLFDIHTIFGLSVDIHGSSVCIIIAVLYHSGSVLHSFPLCLESRLTFSTLFTLKFDIPVFISSRLCTTIPISHSTFCGNKLTFTFVVIAGAKFCQKRSLMWLVNYTNLLNYKR